MRLGCDISRPNHKMIAAKMRLSTMVKDGKLRFKGGLYHPPEVKPAPVGGSHKVEAALAAVEMTTPGDWWVDDRGTLHNDPVGNFCLGRDVGGNSALWGSANRAVISASRELAYEVIRLRTKLKEHGVGE